MGEGRGGGKKRNLREHAPPPRTGRRAVAANPRATLDDATAVGAGHTGAQSKATQTLRQ